MIFLKKSITAGLRCKNAARSGPTGPHMGARLEASDDEEIDQKMCQLTQLSQFCCNTMD